MSLRIFGAILAGGQATRMGRRAKGLLPHGHGGSLIAHLLTELRAAGVADVLIAANDPGAYSRFGVPVVADLRPGLGPLAGIEAALAHVTDENRADAALFLPCDLPAITHRQIGRLVAAFQSRPAGIKIAVTQGDLPRWHALCCIMHRDKLPEIAAALDRGQLKVTTLWEELGAEEVPFEDPQPFENVNTMEEFEVWRKRNSS